MDIEYAFLILIVALAVSRLISEGAYKMLSQDEKGQFMDAFSSLRAFQLIPLVAIISLYFVAEKYLPDYSRLFTLLYFIALSVYIFVTQVIVFRNLRKLNIENQGFHSKFIVSRIVLYVGIAVFFAIIFTE